MSKNFRPDFVAHTYLQNSPPKNHLYNFHSQNNSPILLTRKNSNHSDCGYHSNPDVDQNNNLSKSIFTSNNRKRASHQKRSHFQEPNSNSPLNGNSMVSNLHENVFRNNNCFQYAASSSAAVNPGNNHHTNLQFQTDLVDSEILNRFSTHDMSEVNAILEKFIVEEQNLSISQFYNFQEIVVNFSSPISSRSRNFRKNSGNRFLDLDLSFKVFLEI